MGDAPEPKKLPLVSVSRVGLAVASAIAGGILLFLGWWGVSGESLVALQIPYLASASIPGAALVVAAAVLLVGGRPAPAADPRVDTLLALLTEPVDTTAGSPSSPTTPASPAHSTGPDAP